LDPFLAGPHSEEAVVTQGPAAGRREAGLALCPCSTEAAAMFLRTKDIISINYNLKLLFQTVMTF
jgi:hypothetical protein